MFYQGDLQSGIALAIQEQKLVACFVRKDEDATSQTWESEWLKAPADASETSLGDRLAHAAVFLRLDAGTQEAGFLSAFCSLETTPKLIIIKQGIVLEDIDSRVSEEDFKKRILSHCASHSTQAEQITSATDTASTDVRQLAPSAVQGILEPTDNTSPAPPLAAVQAAAGATSQPTATTLQHVIAERNDPLHTSSVPTAAKDAEKAAAERAKITAGKQKEQSSTTPAARQDWLNQQQTRQQAARAEKERIKKNIELDKQARQERERERRMAARGLNESVVDTPSSFAPQKSDMTRSRTSPTCNLQIRLFDGSSVRSRFDSSATLTGAVRAFVDEQSTSDVPYNFREMRTPLPSRTIEISEENQSLQSLGLTPSATLVLVPVSGYTDAYASSGASGLLSRGVSTGYGLVSGAFGLVGGLLGYGGDAAADSPHIGGVGGSIEPAGAEGSNSVGTGPSSGIKIRTLADQRRHEDKQELYNGNQLNFEPRKKDDDADEEKL